MIGKLVIVGIIIAAIAVVAYSQQDKILGIKDDPTINNVKEDLGDLKDTTVKRVTHEVDKTTNAVGDKIDDVVPEVEKLNPIPKIEQTIAIPPIKETQQGQVYEKNGDTCKISVPKMAKTINGEKELTHTITLPDCKFEENEPVQVTVLTDPNTGQQNISVDPFSQNKIYDTLQLTTTRNTDNTVGIHYEDSSGKTIKVTVTLRNSDKELFTGEFFASKFDTNVDDITDTPHVIEMTVEHSEYGTVSSSVYNPQGNTENTIYGVFSQ